MGWTKGQLCNMAFEEIGLAAYVFDITPEEQASMVLRLDSMMATWELYGLRLGYNRTADPLDADPGQDSGLPDVANQAAWTNLAINAAPSYGKAVAMNTMVTAKQAYDGLISLMQSRPPEVQFKGNLPIGAGAKRPNANGGPFVNPPIDLLTTGPDGLLDFEGPVPV